MKKHRTETSRGMFIPPILSGVMCPEISLENITEKAYGLYMLPSHPITSIIDAMSRNKPLARGMNHIPGDHTDECLNGYYTQPCNKQVAHKFEKISDVRAVAGESKARMYKPLINAVTIKRMEKRKRASTAVILRKANFPRYM